MEKLCIKEEFRNMDITELTVCELQEKLKNKELSVTEITKAYTNRIEEKEKDVQAFVTTLTEEANKKAQEVRLPGLMVYAVVVVVVFNYEIKY